MNNKSRLMGIELLRIISMILIVAGHYNGQGMLSVNVDHNSVNEWFLLMFGFGQKLAVNIFVIIGTYFMVDSKFSGIKLMKIHNQVLFYTLPITLILLVNGFDISIKQVTQACMPILGKPLWFASAWMLLMILSPFLKNVFLLPEKVQRNFCIVYFFVISIMPMISSETDTFLESIFWFVFIYLFIGYIKHSSLKIGFSSKAVLLLSLTLFFSFCLIKGIAQNYVGAIGNLMTSLSNRCIHDIKSIPNFFISLGVFYGFLHLDIKGNKMIDFLAKGSFSVYIVHQVPAFYNVLWTNIFKGVNYINDELFIVIFILQIIGFYGVVSFIDLVRRKLETIWLNAYFNRKIQCLIDSIYNMD